MVIVEIPGFEPGLGEPKSLVLPLHHISLSTGAPPQTPPLRLCYSTGSPCSGSASACRRLYTTCKDTNFRDYYENMAKDILRFRAKPFQIVSLRSTPPTSWAPPSYGAEGGTDLKGLSAPPNSDVLSPFDSSHLPFRRRQRSRPCRLRGIAASGVLKCGLRGKSDANRRSVSRR